MKSPTIINLCKSEININSIIAKLTSPTTGAVAIFNGIVRGLTLKDDEHETTILGYEAYQPMAKDKMEQIAKEIRMKWPTIEGIAIVQRIGRMPPGTITTAIACTAAHRNTGVFEAARFGIDRLKEIVPIWKKEIGPQGEAWIEGHYLPENGE
jgi:molybdopterin synthase catalytic subunit